MKVPTQPLVDGPGELEKPPHLLSQFIDMLIDQQPLSIEQQEERWEHLEQCIYCQSFLGIYLLKRIEDDTQHGEVEESTKMLLSRLTHIMHETLQDDIPAYVEMFVAQGEIQAYKHFPLLTEHLVTCKDCQNEVQTLQIWLRQSA